MQRGISIGKRGFANSLVLRIGLLILISLAVFTGALYQLIGRPTVDRLAESQMGLAAEQLETRIGRLLKSVESTLRSSQGWGKSGDIDPSHLKHFNEFFFPIIANHGEISSVILAHESGREILLLLNGDGRWINRISNPAEWGMQTFWITWSPQREIESVEMRERDYDARERPWFKGAMALADERQLFWTEPYIFFTSKEPGITASMRWRSPDGLNYVIGHDVRLIDLADFTSQLKFGSEGKAALLLKEGRLVAPPKDPRFASRESLEKILLKTAEELQLPEFSEAFTLWQKEPRPARGLHTVKREDGRWLSLFRPITGNTSGIWLGIVAPERDFVPITASDLLLLGLISLAALALGMAVALHIARRFGQPLDALASHSTRIGNLELDEPVNTSAPWREVTQLAGALEEMRQHLREAGQKLRQANTELEDKVAQRTLALRQSQEILQKREAFFRAIFDNAAVGIVSLDKNQKPVLVNRAFAKFIDTPIDHLLARPEDIRLPAETQSLIDQLLTGKLSERSLRSEIEFADRSGMPRWGDVQIAAVQDADGNLDSLLLTTLDVSDRHEIQMELIHQFAFLQALLDTLPNPIFYKGANTRFLGCNTAYEHFFGIGRRDFIGKRVLDLEYLPEDARRSYQAEDEAVIAAGSRLSREVRITDANGEQRDTLYSVSAFRSPDGKPGGLIGVIVDITPLKEAERQATLARQNAEAASAAKANFLANMSHEIRTPMNAIIGMTHLALQTELSARQRNYLIKAENAAKGLLGIINDILDLSKIEAGMMRFEYAPFKLDETLHHLADICTLKMREQGLELLYSVASDVPEELIGDSLRLGQVLLNLVGNAIKFTESGEITVVVKPVEWRGQTVVLQFEVRDTGIGMTPDQQARIFDDFAQGDSSTTRKYGGTGLGLSICKRIVEDQGGTIGVSSTLKVGSSFRFTLPFGLSPESGTLKPPRMGLPDGLNVLIVDDNSSAREIFSQMLLALGIKNHAVSNSGAALEEMAKAQAAGQAYRLLLIDWKMPGLDGIGLIDRLAHRNTAEDAPAIVMATAYDHDELLNALGDLQVGAILSKPATPSSLFDSIVLALNPQPRQTDAKAKAIKQRFAGQRVLLVEDNDVNRELAEEVLINAGLRVDVALDGEQACARVQETNYDLVLMDCHMPVMDGYTATEKIRNELGLKALPIIAMTANALASDRQRCLEIGMNDHIPKPIDFRELYATLARWLGTPASASSRDTLDLPAAKQTQAVAEEIDIAGALERMEGNREMYQRLLGRFHDSQQDIVAQLREAFARSDIEAMILKTHSLRGLGGNIGARELAAIAAELEEKLKDSNPPDTGTVVNLLNRLEQAMPKVLALAKSSVFEPPSPPASSSGQDNTSLIGKLAELKILLENDDATAVSRFQEISSSLRRSCELGQVNQLERHIRQYDYEAALATLKKLADDAH